MMAGLGSLGGLGAGGGGNPLAGLGASSGSGLSGIADLGVGDGGAGQGTGAGGSGLAPAQPASDSQGASFGDTLRSMVIEKPSESKARAGELTARFAAGDKTIDPHTLAITSAKAGVEIQMATRTISSAVSAVRTLFQMQV